MITDSTYPIARGPSNLFGLDYAREAATLQRFSFPIVDAHSHINGDEAVRIYRDAARLYGIEHTFSMTQLEEIPTVKRILGDSIEFISIPRFTDHDRRLAHLAGYHAEIAAFRNHGVRVLKMWNAPRIYEATSDDFASTPLRLTSPGRVAIIEAGVEAGMMFMVHIGDPDTWFATKYKDASKYGTKLDQYDDFRQILARYRSPWIAAHMGGYPEDLAFLSSLLSEFSHLYLDCSATKWIVRELSRHDPVELRAFFARWHGRILFGSDIVTGEAHLQEGGAKSEMGAKASNRGEAFALYASRYWALRTFFETSYDGPSPISDPDLHMVAPEKFTPLDSPTLRGCSLSTETLEWLYYKSAAKLFGLKCASGG
jgi:Amidohydrolase